MFFFIDMTCIHYYNYPQSFHLIFMHSRFFLLSCTVVSFYFHAQSFNFHAESFSYVSAILFPPYCPIISFSCTVISFYFDTESCHFIFIPGHFIFMQSHFLVFPPFFFAILPNHFIFMHSHFILFSCTVVSLYFHAQSFHNH